MRRKKKKKYSRNDTSSKSKKTAAKKTQRVPRTRNAGLWTEAQYFQKIRSALRTGFMWWKPMMAVLKAASRPYKGPNKRQKTEYRCNHCKNFFPRTSVQIDHVVECGSLNSYDDIPLFIQALTKEEPEAFQILCRKCHTEKTKKYLEEKKKLKK